MTKQERKEFVAAFLDEVMEEMDRKGAEYQVNGDYNGNFKRVAAKTGQSVYLVWYSHFHKHLDAIDNFIKDPSRAMAEPISGRIGDAIAYLAILESLRSEGVGDGSGD